MTRVLFVCLGNICRSPMAEYVLRHLAAERGLSDKIRAASAGTSGFHDGEDMHRGTKTVLQRHRIDTGGFTSRKIEAADKQRYDYIVAMDDANLAELERLFGRHPDKLFKLTDLIPESGYSHVPDPWYSGDFDETYTLAEAGCAALLNKIAADKGL
ncbi:putative low molecular weight protein-tyrosine-phosphatase PtpA [Neisseria sp. oral taxon 020 str. F0370]|uniref:low molecular weight protein-tyrosine-phosphatase n=1 Tax=unclassified Neisseria TaxID=2623750 RepID=UPI0002A3E3AE|nr:MULTISPECIES: low molecular weight protein-tyrosine-phosphatase [unclassified Neisseria]ASP16758.1 low molecular weight phosphotyrosine protein phosphatase [Neisseria sp. KEM232]EKY06623.1 putative low molecular weight protein-tyrosine-phosphatase PtpA [Neisseria sp. oral taxon 020 str. F0370]